MAQEKIETTVSQSPAVVRLPRSFVFLSLISLLVVIYFVYFVLDQLGFLNQSAQPVLSQPIKIHYYDNPQIDLQDILVRVFVFQPKDDQTIWPADWRKKLDNVFSQIQAVHKEQFLGFSKMRYVIYPAIITGEHERVYYDQEPLKIEPGVDGKQLNLIMDEINQRISTNELNKISFAPFKYTYLINQVVYTGSNQPVNDNLMLPYDKNVSYTEEIESEQVLQKAIIDISKCCPYTEYVSDFKDVGKKYYQINFKKSLIAGYTNEVDNYNSSLVFDYSINFLDDQLFNPLFKLPQRQATIFYHEMLHTMGVPEGYSYIDFAPETDDIMGGGLNRIISVNYINRDTKKKMGL